MHGNPKTPAAIATKKRYRQRQLQKARTLKAQWVKDHSPCKCGSCDRLEIDHIIPVPNHPNNLRIFTYPKTRQDLELSNCQVLCFSCHRAKTAQEQRKYEHGMNLYDRHGCRCAICRAAAAKHKRDLRRRKHERGIPWALIK